MGRVIKTIEIQGQPAVALFDTGANYSYTAEQLLQGVPRTPLPVSVRVGLGGRTIEIRELCFAAGKIEGLDFLAEVVPVESVGRADGHELDAIIGVRTMEQWEITVDPSTGSLDLEGLRRREFTEF